MRACMRDLGGDSRWGLTALKYQPKVLIPRFLILPFLHVHHNFFFNVSFETTLSASTHRKIKPPTGLQQAPLDLARKKGRWL